MSKCIYCLADTNTLEHALPAAFGEFTNSPNLESRLCADCNSRCLGLLDQQLSRCGPEGFLREYYGVEGRPKHAKINPFARGSAGGRRLDFSTVDRNFGAEVNLEIVNGVTRQICELIFIEIASGKPHHLPLREGMTAAQVREGMTRLRIIEPFETRASFYPTEQEWVQKLIREVCPTVTFSEIKSLSNIIETPIVKFELGERYYRAFAKIGFHYFLTQFTMYTGHEEMFARIREFIYVDTKEPIRRVNEFMNERQLPLLVNMLNPDVVPNGWRAHILAAETKPGVCLAHVQMFLTEEWARVGPIYTIILAKDVPVTQHNNFAHLYQYFPDGKKGRFSGEAKPLPSMRTDIVLPRSKPVIPVD
ncbi:MAG TPA: hypothetical protein VGM02_03405 [Acidobacteriaceae bacterium]|jgi:hypothetical protein